MIYSLYLTHINDTHSHFEPTPLKITLPIVLPSALLTSSKTPILTLPCGGYAMIASALNSQRELASENHTPSLFLHAGDSFQGSLYFSCFKGKANSTILNKLKPDAMTIGNHEFDLGNTPLSKFIADTQFPILAGNMDLQYEDNNKPYPLSVHKQLYSFDHKKNIAQYLLKPLKDKQLAIVGITLDMMDKIGCPDSDCHFLNAIEVTKNTVKHLREQGINHIIILSHLGYQGDLELAQAVDNISVIVGGHSHTLTGDFSELGVLSNESTETFINGALIVQAGKHAESIGLSHLTFDAQGHVTNQVGGVKFLISPTWSNHTDNQWLCSEELTICNNYIEQSTLFESVTPCKEISELIDKDYRPQIKKMHDNVLTTLSQDYHHVRVPNDEYPTGSMIAPLVSEAFYQCANKHLDTDFALHNAGGVRVSLQKGPLTQADVCGRLLPFEIQIISYRVTGKDLALALEGGINNALNNGVTGSGDGSYPYCHGLKFTYCKDNIIGNRIKDFQILSNNKWQEVDLAKHYNGVSSAYTIAGKEGYDSLLNSTNIKELPYSMSDAFTLYLQTINL